MKALEKIVKILVCAFFFYMMFGFKEDMAPYAAILGVFYCLLSEILEQLQIINKNNNIHNQ
jgi:hypothetical protein